MFHGWFKFSAPQGLPRTLQSLIRHPFHRLLQTDLERCGFHNDIALQIKRQPTEKLKYVKDF